MDGDGARKRRKAAPMAARKKPRRDKSEFVSVEVGMREFKKRLAAGDAAKGATTEVENLTQAVKPRAKPKAEKAPTKKTATVKKAPVRRTTRAKTAAASKMTLSDVKAQLEREQKERVEQRIQSLHHKAIATVASAPSSAPVPVASVAVVTPVDPLAQLEPSGALEQQNKADYAINAVPVAVPAAVSPEQPVATGNQVQAIDTSVCAIPTSPAQQQSIPVAHEFIADDLDEDLMFAMALEEVEQKLATPQKALPCTDIVAGTDPNSSASISLQSPIPFPVSAKSVVEVQPVTLLQSAQVADESKEPEPAVGVSPEVLEEMERLRRENELLRRSNELLQAAVTSPLQAEAPADKPASPSPKDCTANEPRTDSTPSPASTDKPTARYLDLGRCDSDHGIKKSIFTGEDSGANKITSHEPAQATPLSDHRDSGDHSLVELQSAEQEQVQESEVMSPEIAEPMELSSLNENTDEQLAHGAPGSGGDESDVSMSDADEDEDRDEAEAKDEDQAMEGESSAPRSSTIDTGNYSEYKAHQETELQFGGGEDLEDSHSVVADASDEKMDPAPTTPTLVDPKPFERMVTNEPDASLEPGTPVSSENLERTTAPSDSDDEDTAEDEDEAPATTRVKRREVIAMSSSSSSSESESESEDDESSEIRRSNVLEAALRAAGGDSGRKIQPKPSSATNGAVKKGDLRRPTSDLSSPPPSLQAKLASKKRKSPGLPPTSTKRPPSVKSSLLWPALDEFYDFLLDISPKNVRGSEIKRAHLQQYSGGKLPAQHSSIDDYCSVQLEAIMEELVASVSNTTDRRGGGGSGPTRHLSLASVSPCGVQGMATPSVGLSLGAIFSESGFTGSTSNKNDYILTFDASALGKKAASDFLSGDLVLLRSPRWKNYEMCVFGVVLCDSVVAVGGKAGGKGGSGESDQICVLIRAHQRDRDDAVENFNVLTELCLSNQRVANWRWSMQQVHNTTTSAREFQAIKSISFFPNDLKQVLLSGKVELAKSQQSKESSIISPRLLKYLHKHYNNSQVEAILGCLGENSRVIIQGPPGTGKTKTILGLLSALLDGAGLSTLQKAKGTARIRIGASLQSARTSAVSKTVAETSIRVLVAAPSNAAVDELVVRILSKGLFDGEKGESYRPRIVRVGRPESSQQLSSLAAAREASESKKNRKKMRKYAREVEEVLLESLVTKHRSSFPTVKQARQAIIKNAQIVFCTLSGAGSVAMCEFAQDFDALIIDEAAQAVESSTLIPFKFRPHRVVLVGDHRQLPATVISKKLVTMGYDRSLQQRLVENGSPVLLLNQQYRMHPEIAEFPSAHFYDGRLVQDDNMREWTAQDYHRDRAFKPLLFLDVQGTQSQVSGSTSLRNMSEVEAVAQLIRRLLTKFPRIEWKKRIGVIAPYKQQIYEVRGAIGKLETEFDRRLGIEVNTVDGFQGREKEIIIYSCVRTSHGGRKKKRRSSGGEDDVLDAFWADERRMNVAITRAKSSLWIVGNANLLKQSRAWRALIQHTKDHKRYINDGAASLFADNSVKRKKGSRDE